MRRIAGVLLLLAALCGTQAPAQAGRHKPHPALADTERAWLSYFGAHTPNSGKGVDNWLPCPNHPSTARLMVTFVDNRSIMISGQWCGLGRRPTSAENLAAARAFFPRDTRARGRVTTDQGTDQEFSSAGLARQPAAALATDCNGNPTTPGLFTFAPDMDGNGDWDLAIGTCA